jgi:hypothetical protein
MVPGESLENSGFDVRFHRASQSSRILIHEFSPVLTDHRYANKVMFAIHLSGEEIADVVR